MDRGASRSARSGLSVAARRAILIATSDPLGAAMAGPAIRAWHFADELAKQHDVRLVTLSKCERTSTTFDVLHLGDENVVELERWMDVLVFQGGVLRLQPHLAASSKPIVADIYDPFHLENLEPTDAHRTTEARSANLAHLNGVLNDQMRRADFFLCASERQRDFWLGSLTALGRLTPEAYDDDPTLRKLIDVVPFGVADRPAHHRAPAIRGVVPGISVSDSVLLWGGGVYNWFDPVSLVDAVAGVRGRVPRVRLYFLGMQHPNPDIPQMSAARDVRARSEALGLTGVHVFFNEGWVPYDERESYLLEADVAVSTHRDHIESSYSFRTRILDYLWAGRPIVTTAGDGFAELVEKEDLGGVVPPEDPRALQEVLTALLEDDARRAGCGARSAAIASRFRWGDVVAPLVEFCAAPRRAASCLGQPVQEPSALVSRRRVRRLLGR